MNEKHNSKPGKSANKRSTRKGDEMRKITNQNPYTKIIATDDPSRDGLNHEYCIGCERLDSLQPEPPLGEYGHVKFQKGPIQEQGVNGCQIEDLLAIAIDRLWSFQSGPFACIENDNALLKCGEALTWLTRRSCDRRRRRVEGKSLK